MIILKAGVTLEREYSRRVMFQRVFPGPAAEAGLWSPGPCHTLSIPSRTGSAFRAPSPEATPMKTPLAAWSRDFKPSGRLVSFHPTHTHTAECGERQ